MNRIHGHLREMKGWALENWGAIIRDPWLQIAGRRERLLGSLEASLSLPVSSLQPYRRVDKPRSHQPGPAVNR
jgi:hypothetical protein